MGVKLGRGFEVNKDGRVYSFRHKLGSVSQQIKARKSKKPRAVSRAKAMAKGQRP